MNQFPQTVLFYKFFVVVVAAMEALIGLNLELGLVSKYMCSFVNIICSKLFFTIYGALSCIIESSLFAILFLFK